MTIRMQLMINYSCSLKTSRWFKKISQMRMDKSCWFRVGRHLPCAALTQEHLEVCLKRFVKVSFGFGNHVCSYCVTHVLEVSGNCVWATWFYKVTPGTYSAPIGLNRRKQVIESNDFGRRIRSPAICHHHEACVFVKEWWNQSNASYYGISKVSSSIRPINES